MVARLRILACDQAGLCGGNAPAVAGPGVATDPRVCSVGAPQWALAILRRYGFGGLGRDAHPVKVVGRSPHKAWLAGPWPACLGAEGSAVGCRIFLPHQVAFGRTDTEDVAAIHTGPRSDGQSVDQP